jgi:uncharacterized integral membrane protein (TIGR00698 family)
VSRTDTGQTRSQSWRRLVPGVALALVLAALATPLGLLLPVIGAPVFAIVLGLLLGPLALRVGGRDRLEPGTGFAKGFLLQLAVVVLGSGLSLLTVARVGFSSLPVMLGTLAICLVVAWFVGRRLGIDDDLTTLIGVGTAICGASAIAAVSPVMKARSNDVAYAVSTIFLFNVAAVLAFPPLGHLLGLDQQAFGLFAGTAVNDTSSVVAAASVYGPEAANTAVVVKLTRTLMIIPIVLVLAAVVRRRDTSSPSTRSTNPLRLVPWFLVGFLVAAGLNTLGVIPGAAQPALAHVGLFLITTALAAIGVSTDVPALRRTGARPLVLGLVLWLTVAASSLVIQGVTG